MTSNHQPDHQLGHRPDHDYEDWRELARQLQEEKNPQKMIALVEQLIAKFDEQHARKGQPPKAEPPKPSGSPQA